MTYIEPYFNNRYRRIIDNKYTNRGMKTWDYDYTNEKKVARDLKEGYVYESHRGNTVNIDGFFIKAIDMEEVKSIQIGEKSIPVN